MTVPIARCMRPCHGERDTHHLCGSHNKAQGKTVVFLVPPPQALAVPEAFLTVLLQSIDGVWRHRALLRPTINRSRPQLTGEKGYSESCFDESRFSKLMVTLSKFSWQWHTIVMSTGVCSSLAHNFPYASGSFTLEVLASGLLVLDLVISVLLLAWAIARCMLFPEAGVL